MKEKPFRGQAKGWQQTKKCAPWQAKQPIGEMEVKQEAKQGGNPECPQYEGV